VRATLLAAALLVGACGGGSAVVMTQADAGTVVPDAPVPTPIALVDWVDDLVDHHTNDTDKPDTVDDKVIIDTDQTAPFDRFVGQ